MTRSNSLPAANSDRSVVIGKGLARLPERLLTAHAQGKVLFVCGAGISLASGLPDFRKLVEDIYAKCDPSLRPFLGVDACGSGPLGFESLTDVQRAERNRYCSNEYDTALGMLERRIDGQQDRSSKVRQAAAEILRTKSKGPAPIHRALMRLANRGGVSSIVTTNFDLLLEDAGAALAQGSGRSGPSIETYSLGAIPRPNRREDFAGVFHIHGALDRVPGRLSDILLTDEDLGEFYLRRRVVPDFIYDAARLYHLVLVGYSLNDPPMRYLLNAVSADASRFSDIKEQFVFVPDADPVTLADWKARGIIPIAYEGADKHVQLWKTLEKWAQLFENVSDLKAIEAEVRRIVRKSPDAATEADQDLFRHIIRRSGDGERRKLAAFVAELGAGIGWLTVIHEAVRDPISGVRP